MQPSAMCLVYRLIGRIDRKTRKVLDGASFALRGQLRDDPRAQKVLLAHLDRTIRDLQVLRDFVSGVRATTSEAS